MLLASDVDVDAFLGTAPELEDTWAVRQHFAQRTYWCYRITYLAVCCTTVQMSRCVNALRFLVCVGSLQFVSAHHAP
jgi:hypothetical protein